MDRDALIAELAALTSAPGEVLYVRRRGVEYGYRLVPEGGDMLPDGAPEVWLFYQGRWANDGAARRAQVEDLLAEMESMAGGPDRCRWPLEAPYSDWG
jgi:hypothetical protein